jgi:hypothetical protein
VNSPPHPNQEIAMFPIAYIFRQPLAANRPSRWDIQVRYALRLPDETVDLPAGTWLLALSEPGDVCPEQGQKNRTHPTTAWPMAVSSAWTRR